MNMRILIFFMMVSGMTLAQSNEYKEMLKEYYSDFPTISCEDASKLIGQENVYFLDTREQTEFDVSHIQHARCVGYKDFNLNRVKHIPKDAQIIVYCSIGARSQNVGEKLKAAGYTNIKNLYGGFFHWSNLGYTKYNKKHQKTDRIHGYSKEWSKWIYKGTVVY